MADPLERVTNLVALLLHTRVPLAAEQIFFDLDGAYPADENARHTMFERDKRTLREAGVPLRTEADLEGRLGYRIDGDEWFLPEMDLSAEERLALHVAVAGVHLGVSWGDDALAKVAGPDGAAAAPPAAVAAEVAALPQLPALVDAQRRRARVRFEYRGRARDVEPWAVLLRDGFWYLAGRDLGRGELRHFRVDRMAGELEVGEAGAYAPPADYSPGDGFPQDPKLLGDDQPVEARVRVWPPHAARVVRELGPDRVLEEAADGSVVVQVTVRHRGAFRSWVLGLLDHAEVEGPPELRAELVAWLRALARPAAGGAG